MEIIKIPLTGQWGTGKFAIIDDTPKNRELAKHRWCIHMTTWGKKDGKRGGAYVVGWHKGKYARLHHIILPDCPKGFVRDHINRDPLDNRESNLRLATYKESANNRKKRWDSVDKYSNRLINSK
jgi:hypothetical protein